MSVCNHPCPVSFCCALLLIFCNFPQNLENVSDLFTDSEFCSSTKTNLSLGSDSVRASRSALTALKTSAVITVESVNVRSVLWVPIVAVKSFEFNPGFYVPVALLFEVCSRAGLFSGNRQQVEEQLVCIGE